MTSLPLPLPPDDPRQVKALEAATDATYRGSGLLPGLQGARTIMRGHVLDGLAAYFSALQTEGVRFVPAPPCKACEGTGKKFNDDDAAMGYITPPCPRCNGSGLARMVALDDVEAALNDGAHLIFDCGVSPQEVLERRFSGTGEEPHG